MNHAAAGYSFGHALRQPPQNLQAEQALLGALLANNRVYENIGEFLAPAHFYDPLHGAIYETAGRIIAGGGLADARTLRAELEHSDALADAGGIDYLATLIAAMVSISGAPEYGRAIRDCWVRRELLDGLGQAAEACYLPPPEGAPAIVEQAESLLLRIAGGAGEEAPSVPLGDAVHTALLAAQDAARRGVSLAGLSTGYAALDRMTSGLMRGDTAVIAARPSMGKTALGLGIAIRAAARGVPVLFWSGEMSAAQLGARAAAARADLDTTSAFTGHADAPPDESGHRRRVPLPPGDWGRLCAAERAAARLPLQIDSRAAITVASLRMRARRMKRSKSGLGLLVVDYLGLMRGTDTARRNGRYAEASEVSADMKALAVELQVPVLALVQLNRNSESREDKRPTMADLRDSGAIEQDAAQVLLLHRPHYYLSRAPMPERKPRETDEDFSNRTHAHFQAISSSEGLAEIAVAKNRHGPTGLTRLRFTDRTTWFRDELEPDGGSAWLDDGGSDGA